MIPNGMVDRLEIFNGALVLIGHKTMTYEWEDSPQGQSCRQFYDNAFLSVLNTVAWPFAYREAELEPAFDQISSEQLGTFTAALDGLAVDPVTDTVLSLIHI